MLLALPGISVTTLWGPVLVLLGATGLGAALGMCASLPMAYWCVLATLPQHITAVNQLLLSLGFAADATAGMCIPAGMLGLGWNGCILPNAGCKICQWVN